jgi:hypothetical protein
MMELIEFIAHNVMNKLATVQQHTVIGLMFRSVYQLAVCSGLTRTVLCTVIAVTH